jgi:hypothetical protein
MARAPWHYRVNDWWSTIRMDQKAMDVLKIVFPVYAIADQMVAQGTENITPGGISVTGGIPSVGIPGVGPPTPGPPTPPSPSSLTLPTPQTANPANQAATGFFGGDIGAASPGWKGGLTGAPTGPMGGAGSATAFPLIGEEADGMMEAIRMLRGV